MSLVKLNIKNLHTQKQIEEFLEYIKDSTKKYEISLLNISKLSLDIILRFNAIKNNLILKVENKKLKHYLTNLGFDVYSLFSTTHSSEHLLANINYVAIGGSAGSLKKIINFIKYLPASKLTIFIIIHQKTDTQSYLKEILQKYTIHYKVVDVIQPLQIEPSTIYLAPPSKHIIVEDNTIQPNDDEKYNFSKPSISITFKSLSYKYKEQLLVILVCGYGMDGSDSLEVIKHNGGIVFIEQPFECDATAMLENAINTKKFDKILSLNDMSKLIYDKLKYENDIEIGLDDFLEQIYLTYRYDYRNYHKSHIIRRINYFYNKSDFTTYKEFQQKVLTNKSIFENLFLDISVNVTTFFRDYDVYKQIKKELQKRFANQKHIKIWCAGCSSGEEPYSVAILLDELGLLNRSIIYATDINDTMIQFAKNGIYSKQYYQLFWKNYDKISDKNIFDQYFDHYDNFVVIKDRVKNKIIFFKHNLVTDDRIDEFQLIFCRNVIIYFNKNLTSKVFDIFDRSLEQNGILVLGESENFDQLFNYHPISKKQKIYLKGNQ